MRSRTKIPIPTSSIKGEEEETCLYGRQTGRHQFIEPSIRRGLFCQTSLSAPYFDALTLFMSAQGHFLFLLPHFSNAATKAPSARQLVRACSVSYTTRSGIHGVQTPKMKRTTKKSGGVNNSCFWAPRTFSSRVKSVGNFGFLARDDL